MCKHKWLFFEATVFGDNLLHSDRGLKQVINEGRTGKGSGTGKGRKPITASLNEQGLWVNGSPWPGTAGGKSECSSGLRAVAGAKTQHSSSAYRQACSDPEPRESFPQELGVCGRKLKTGT